MSILLLYNYSQVKPLNVQRLLHGQSFFFFFFFNGKASNTHRNYIRKNLWYNNRGSVLHPYRTICNILGMLSRRVKLAAHEVKVVSHVFDPAMICWMEIGVGVSRARAWIMVCESPLIMTCLRPSSQLQGQSWIPILRTKLEGFKKGCFKFFKLKEANFLAMSIKNEVWDWFFFICWF